ncbi:hypothetical protein HPB47_009354, partial [Ixodes persulcatus]
SEEAAVPPPDATTRDDADILRFLRCFEETTKRDECTRPDDAEPGRWRSTSSPGQKAGRVGKAVSSRAPSVPSGRRGPCAEAGLPPLPALGLIASCAAPGGRRRSLPRPHASSPAHADSAPLYRNGQATTCAGLRQPAPLEPVACRCVVHR